jgi:hypothetical protein
MIIELGKVTDETQSTTIPSPDLDEAGYVRLG